MMLRGSVQEFFELAPVSEPDLSFDDFASINHEERGEPHDLEGRSDLGDIIEARADDLDLASVLVFERF